MWLPRLRRSDIIVVLATLLIVQVAVMLFIDSRGVLPSAATADAEEGIQGLLSETFAVERSSSPARRRGDSSPFHPATAPNSGGERVGPGALFPEHFTDLDALFRVEIEGVTADEVALGDPSQVREALDSTAVSLRRKFLSEGARKHELPEYALATVLGGPEDGDAAVALGATLRSKVNCLANRTCASFALLAWAGSDPNATARLRLRLQQAGWAAVVALPQNVLPYSHHLLFALHRFKKVLYVSAYSLHVGGDMSSLFLDVQLMPSFSSRTTPPTLTVPCIAQQSSTGTTTEVVRDFELLPSYRGSAPGRVRALLFVAFRMPDAARAGPLLRCDVSATRSYFAPENALVARLAGALQPRPQQQPHHAPKLDRDHDWARQWIGADAPRFLFIVWPYTLSEMENWIVSLRDGHRRSSVMDDDARILASFASVFRSFERGDVLLHGDDVVERVWIAAVELAARRSVTRLAAFTHRVRGERRSDALALARRAADLLFGGKIPSRVRFPRAFAPLAGAFFTLPERESQPPLLAVGLHSSVGVVNISTYVQMQVAANWTVDGMTLVTGNPGESCAEVCRRQRPNTALCVPAALAWTQLNDCDRSLRAAFHECSTCTMDLAGLAVAPAARLRDSTCAMFNLRSPEFPSCAAAHPEFSRLCPCVDAKGAAHAVAVHASASSAKQLTPAAHAPEASADTGDESALGPSATEQLQEEIGSSRSDAAVCPCHPQGIAPATETQEQRCLEYIANFSNVLLIEALVSDLKLGRTVKFRLTYKDACVRAIAKVPQSLFPLEPYAEYTAFELDRLLKMRMIPPTSWIFIPLTALESAALASSNERRPDGGIVSLLRTKRGSGAREDDGSDVSAYGKWVAKEVMMFAVSHNLVATDPVSGRMVLGCSVQLWLSGVMPMHRTPFRFDESYGRLLTAAGARRRAAGTLLSSPLARGVIRPTTLQRNVDAVMQYLSDTYVFDTIIGNDDRGSIKNSNAMRIKTDEFVSVSDSGVSPASLGVPVDGFLPVHLDQGKSFYTEPMLVKFLLDEQSAGEGSDDDFDLVSQGKTGTTKAPPGVCMFRNETFTILKTLLSPAPRLINELRAVLPGPIFKRIEERHLNWAQTRLTKIVMHMERCIAALGSAVALPW